jgi:hypothetical protein
MAGKPVELLVESRRRILEAPDSLISHHGKQDLLLILGALAARVIEDRRLIQRLLMEVQQMGDKLFFDLDLLDQAVTCASLDAFLALLRGDAKHAG